MHRIDHIIHVMRLAMYATCPMCSDNLRPGRSFWSMTSFAVIDAGTSHGLNAPSDSPRESCGLHLRILAQFDRPQPQSFEDRSFMAECARLEKLFLSADIRMPRLMA